MNDQKVEQRLERVNRQIEILEANLTKLDKALARSAGYVRRLVNALNTLGLPEVDEDDDTAGEG